MDVAGPAPDHVMRIISTYRLAQIGTGCLLGGSLVLTASHFLPEDGDVIVSSASGDRWRAQVEWSETSADAALVRIVDTAFTELPQLLIGEVPSAPGAVHKAEALGFPSYASAMTGGRDARDAAAPSTATDLVHLVGQVPSVSEMAPGAFEFVVTSPKGERTSDGRPPPWAGISGAPVWIAGRLIGILTESLESSALLRGIRIDHLQADASFATLTLPASGDSEGTTSANYGSEPPPMSRSAHEVVAHATSVAQGRPVDASMVLLSALRYCHDNRLPGVTSSLLSALAARHPETPEVGELLERLGHALGIADSGQALDIDAVAALVQAPPLSLLLAHAAGFAERISGRREVHLRHLVLATAVASDPPLRSELLAQLGVSAAALRLMLRDAARSTPDGDPAGAWEALLPAASADSARLAGGVNTDLVDPTHGIPLDHDHLDARVWVSMLANVIADAGTPMPLSVGLFGQWGSGKSYFMGLLRSEIERLSASGREPYLAHVVQIGFNAWHYADTNLWASLGDEIFGQLAGPTQTADESRRLLRQELAKGSAERQVLEAHTAQATDDTVRLQAELQAATARREFQATDLLAAVMTSKVLGEQLDKVWQRLGIRDEVQQAQALADEVRGTAEAAGRLRDLLSQHRTWILGGIAATALLAIAATMWIPARWGTWLRSGGGTALILVVGTAATWIARAKSGLTQLRTLAADFSRGVGSAEERHTAAAVNYAVGELRRAEAQEKVAQAQLDEVQARVGQLARQLSELMPGQRLYSFLADRAASGSYAGQLGLISTIRKDFEHLVELLRDWRAEGDGESAHRPIDRIVLYIDDLDRCQPQQVVEVLQAVHLLLALDLFVVVVGVDPRWLLRSLQHQFDGILNVDAPLRSAEQMRWDVTPLDYLEKIFNIPFALPGIPPGGLGRMLRGLAAAGDADRKASSAAPTEEPLAQEPLAQEALAQEALAQEALAQEALAQEPLAQEPLSEETQTEESLAQEAKTDDSLSAEPKTEEPPSQKPPAQRSPSEEPPAEIPPSDRPPSDRPPSDRPPSDRPPAQPVLPAADGQPAPTPPPAAGTTLPAETPTRRAQAAEEPPRPLTEPELALLGELESFVGTPREAKRLFNLYRMLRSARDLCDAASFLGDNHAPGDYQAVAVLLGMLAADGRMVGQMLDAAPQADPPVAGGLLDRPASGHWHDFVADLAPVPDGNRWTNQIIGQIRPEEVPAWKQFAAAAARTNHLITQQDLTAFKRWAPRIRRFSFALSPLDHHQPSRQFTDPVTVASSAPQVPSPAQAAD